MFKQVTRWLDPILFIGLFVSIAVSVAMVLTGNETLSSLIVGLLSTIVTLLIDIIARIQKVENSFLDAADLSRVLSDETIGKTMREIAYSIASINGFNFEHYNKIAEIYIDECKTKLREIAAGSVTVPSRTPQAYGVVGIQQVQKDMKVIHISKTSFWTSDFGRRYFEMNRAALKRGVHITRIFALTPEEMRDSLDILKEQEKAGVNVVVVRRDRVSHEFTIFDNRVVIDYDVDVKQDYTLERIVIDTTQVKRRVEEFQNLIARYGKTVKEISQTTSAQ